MRGSEGGFVKRVRGSIFCLMTLPLGCASGAGEMDGRVTAPDLLLAGVPRGGAQAETALIDDREVLAVSAEMRDFLNSSVHHKAGSKVKFQELIDAIVSARNFGLKFDEITRTAAETFRLRRGNCLSFSNMFIAMAREVGLDAAFQEVDIPPDWTVRNDTFVLNRHINVTVDLGTGGIKAVDFNLGDFRASYDRRTISDMRALAHFFNNLGVERMQAGDTAAAAAYFRKAIDEYDSRFSPAWTNLGTLFLREGYPADAEAAYLQAVRADRKDEVAMSNLANLYELQGDSARAAFFRDQVVSHRNRNPYYHYYLARMEYSNQNYNEAINHLKFAILKKRNEDQFYSLLSMCYLKTGDQRAARRWLARAERVAATNGENRSPPAEIDTLPPASQ